MYYDLNGVPDGARFIDLHPENRDPTAPATASPTAAALPAEFLRPYRGYQNIRDARQFRGRRLSFAAAAGEPALHRAAAVRRRLHAAALARRRRRGSGQPVVRVQPSVRFLLLGADRRATARAWSSTTPGTFRGGTADRRARCSTAGSCRARATSCPATGRTSR